VRGRHIAAAVGLVLALCVPAAAHAGPIGEQTLVASGLQSSGGPIGNPAAAYDAVLDDCLIVWSSDHESPGTGAIWGRFVTPDGVPLGTSFKIANVAGVADGRDAFNPRVVYAPLYRQFFVTFAGEVGRGSDLEIYGIWLDDQGERTTAVLPISQGTAGSADHPQVASNDKRGTVSVVYFASRPNTGTQVYAQLVTPAQIGIVNRISPTDAVVSAYPTIAHNQENGEALIAATTQPSGAPQEPVVYRVTQDLQVLGQGVRPVPAGTGSGHKPAVAWNPGRNEYALAWPRVIGDGAEIWVARFSADLKPLGAPAQITSIDPPGNQSGVGAGVDVGIAASKAADQYAVFWPADTSASDATSEVWMRSLGGDGAALDDPALLSTMGPAPGTALSRELLTGAIATDTTRGQWLVPWPGKTQAGGLNPTQVGVFVRPAAAYAPPPPPTVVPTPPPSPCSPGMQPYSTRRGVRCGPPPVPAFSVSAGVLKRNRRLAELAIRPTTTASKVSARCIKRCGRRSSVVTRRGGRSAKTIPAAGLKAGPGATIEIRLARPNATTRYLQLRVLGRTPYLKRIESGCRTPDALKAAC
jgi:hypothetical protein